MESCFTEVLDGPVDAGMLVLDWPDETNDDADWWPTLQAIESASARTGTKAIVVTTLPENLPARVRDHLHERGLSSASTIDEALVGLAACAQVGGWFEGSSPGLHDGTSPIATTTATLGEFESKALLSDFGVSIPSGGIFAGPDLPGRLHYPLVAKITGSDHKTEAGGVITDILNETELAAAADRLRPLSNELLIEEMVCDGVAELLVSVRREPSIGLISVIGAGGSLVELFDDSTTMLLPSPESTVIDHLQRTRVGRLLAGIRGKTGGDIGAVARTMTALARAMGANADIVEIEINPLIVTATDAVAADALVVKERT